MDHEPSRRFRDAAFRIVCVGSLFFAAVAPVFRTDELAKVLGFAGSSGLFALALLFVFRGPRARASGDPGQRDVQ